MRTNSLHMLLLAVLLALFSGRGYADNSYGLRSNIQEGTILHCFDWTYNDIKAMIPDIAKAGFTAVQTSPAQKGAGTGVWWWLYQPLGFYVGDSGLGDESALKSLCETAHQYGVKVVVDVVANHLAGDHTNIQSDLKDGQYWHNYSGGIDYTNRWQITHGDIGMADINSENTYVQQKVHDYIVQLKSDGVDGIRWDAAKHIGLPSESCGFWPAVTNTGLWNYGEILEGPTDNGGDAQMKEYTSYISVTDNNYGRQVTNAFNGGGVPSIAGNWSFRGVSDDKLVYWAESHDTYSNDGGETKNIGQNVIDRAYAVVAAQNGATALYFSRPSSTDKNSIKIGQKGSTHFTSKEVAAVNHFHNALVGEKSYYSGSNGVASVCRKNGAVIVKGSGSGYVTATNGGGYTTPGTYTDEVSGGTFTVTSTTITGNVGSSGIAVIYKGSTSGAGETGGETGGDVTEAYTPTLDKADELSCFFETSDGNGVKAWIWDSSNNYTGGAWPGEAMTLMGKASNGNYIYKWTYNGTLTSTPTNVIFTHNGGTKFNDADGTFTNHGYYTESSAITATQTITKVKDSGSTGGGETGGDANIHVYVKASVAPYIYVWYDDNGTTKEPNGDWNNTKAMTASSDGWYVYTAPAGVSPINFILTSTAGGDKLTADVTNVTSDVYYAVNGSSAAETSERPSTGGSTGGSETTGKVLVYYNNPNKWSSVNCYLYNSETDSYAKWPGTSMTCDATLTHDGVTGWWKIEVPSDYTKGLFIVNDGGSNQYPAAMEPGLQLNGKTVWLKDTSLMEDDGTTTSISRIDAQATEAVNVYTLAGQLVKRGVKAQGCLDGLAKGVYIVNGKKVVK